MMAGNNITRYWMMILVLGIIIVMAIDGRKALPKNDLDDSEERENLKREVFKALMQARDESFIDEWLKKFKDLLNINDN
ncbi:unnamed protein product [Adineta steineri]|uniref:Uncharacterized protein n=1 Tax=Adineta steineri TaxID=433720 RepID=A0A819MZ60_9BILA|nr:unnamed protein product [Adineta steineri]